MKKPKITFNQFIEKHPDKLPIWESMIGKKWNGEKFI